MPPRSRAKAKSAAESVVDYTPVEYGSRPKLKKLIVRNLGRVPTVSLHPQKNRLEGIVRSALFKCAIVVGVVLQGEVFVSPSLIAQGVDKPSRIKRVKLVPIGLPEDAKVNSTMFRGIILTPHQGKAIVRLADKFTREDAERNAKRKSNLPMDSVEKARLLPSLEKQRLAYRAVLSSEQQEIFDENTREIIKAWLNTSGQPSVRSSVR